MDKENTLEGYNYNQYWYVLRSVFFILIAMIFKIIWVREEIEEAQMLAYFFCLFGILSYEEKNTFKSKYSVFLLIVISHYILFKLKIFDFEYLRDIELFYDKILGVIFLNDKYQSNPVFIIGLSYFSYMWIVVKKEHKILFLPNIIIMFLISGSMGIPNLYYDIYEYTQLLMLFLIIFLSVLHINYRLGYKNTVVENSKYIIGLFIIYWYLISSLENLSSL